jgi:hypothetical protein
LLKSVALGFRRGYSNPFHDLISFSSIFYLLLRAFASIKLPNALKHFNFKK